MTKITPAPNLWEHWLRWPLRRKKTVMDKNTFRGPSNKYGKLPNTLKWRLRGGGGAALGHVRGFEVEVFVKFWFQIVKTKNDRYPQDKAQCNDYTKTPGVLPQTSICYVGERETETRKKRRQKRPKHPTKLALLKVVIQTCEKPP